MDCLIEIQALITANSQGTKFHETLFLKRTSYKRILIRWLNIHNFYYDDSAYLSLLENFKNNGYYEDYENGYYKYRIEHRNQPGPGIHPLETSFRTILDVSLQYLYGYGKRPLNPLAWSLFVMIIFGLFWKWAGYDGQNRWLDEYSHADARPIESPARASNFWKEINILLAALTFSATVFLSGTKLFIDPPAAPDTLRLKSSLIRRIFILERLLGALFSILFFLAISGTVIR
jgi:hypothetical protein